MDVLPTILEVVAIDAPDQLRGVSLVDRRRSNRDSRAVISEHPIFREDRKAVVQGMLKYIRSMKTGSERFMNLASKDFRDREVSQEVPETDKQRMRQLMEQALTGRGATAGEFVDQGILEKMRALGYVA